ncbi:MAG TPA: flagellar basal-body MS-ring/collar protein FliF [Dokdonella sp.]|nr:flagellar basal-body MS-ring/collar protein FliF [Dokdonella sp.]
MDPSLPATQSPSTKFDIARIPGARQVLLLVGIAAAVAIGVAIVLWSRAPNFALLYGNLDERDAAQVVQALQAANIQYELGAGGTSIFVSASDISATRLRLASQGLPHSGSGGSTAGGGSDAAPFGMSELAERTRYQQQLENDLSSTIASLQSIKAARVHLAMPKSSAFIRDRGRASASVMVSIYPGRALDNAQVGAIVHLVAASVPDLDPAQVSVVDQKGALLTVADPGSAEAINDTRFRLVRQIETAYAGRIEELLSPLVGAGRVRAQVVAQLDFTETEKTSEIFDPEKTPVRSEQTSSERRVDAKASGVPGALSNQPPTAPAQANAAANAGPAPEDSEVSSSATRNFEIGRTISHTREPVGNLRRLSVAVALDNKSVIDAEGKVSSVPLSAEEITRMTDLVRNAVGFDASRGDTVSVVNAPFQNDPLVEPVDMPLWEQPMLRELFKQGLGVVLVLLLVFTVLRPLFRNLVPPQNRRSVDVNAGAPGASGGLDVAADSFSLSGRAAGGIPGTLAPSNVALDTEQKILLAKRVAGQDPKQVAQIVKSWVTADA